MQLRRPIRRQHQERRVRRGGLGDGGGVVRGGAAAGGDQEARAAGDLRLPHGEERRAALVHDGAHREAALRQGRRDEGRRAGARAGDHVPHARDARGVQQRARPQRRELGAHASTPRARASASSLSRVSASSPSGVEPWTIPAPANRWARGPSSTAERSATASSPSLGGVEPTDGARVPPPGEGLVLRQPLQSRGARDAADRGRRVQLGQHFEHVTVRRELGDDRRPQMDDVGQGPELGLAGDLDAGAEGFEARADLVHHVTVLRAVLGAGQQGGVGAPGRRAGQRFGADLAAALLDQALRRGAQEPAPAAAERKARAGGRDAREALEDSRRIHRRRQLEVHAPRHHDLVEGAGRDAVADGAHRGDVLRVGMIPALHVRRRQGRGPKAGRGERELAPDGAQRRAALVQHVVDAGQHRLGLGEAAPHVVVARPRREGEAREGPELGRFGQHRPSGLRDALEAVGTRRAEARCHPEPQPQGAPGRVPQHGVVVAGGEQAFDGEHRRRPRDDCQVVGREPRRIRHFTLGRAMYRWQTPKDRRRASSTSRPEASIVAANSSAGGKAAMERCR